jgi:hypothetical protein
MLRAAERLKMKIRIQNEALEWNCLVFIATAIEIEW